MNTPTFQQFWDTYALKRDRYAAERVWKRLSATDRRAALDGIADYRADCLQRGISMMYGQGYLSHRRWEDEPTATPYPATPQPKPEPPGQGNAIPDMEVW